MKKFLIITFFIVTSFLCIKEVWAVSYNWSATHSIPTFQSSTWSQIYFDSTTPFYSFWKNVSWAYDYQNTFYLRSSSWFIFSWTIVETVNCNSCTVWKDMFTNKISYNSTLKTLYLEWYSWNYNWWAWIPANISNKTLRSTLILNDLHLWKSCSWLSSDCLIYLLFNYHTDSNWTYVDKTTLYEYFSWSTNLWITTIYDNLNVNPFYTTAWNNDQISLTSIWTYTWMTSTFIFIPIASSFLSSDYLQYWIDWTDPINKFNTLKWPQFYWSSWSVITIWWWSWSTQWSWSIFDVCTSFLDVWCYVKTIWDYVISSIFPEVSFSWEFNSCASWSTNSWSFMQKLWNVFAIINPIPPSNWTIVCTPFWTWVIQYQKLTAWWNFFTVYASGAWLPSILYSDWKVIFWQTILDLILIFVIIVLIFYKVNHQND